jgi:hypothetical protein
MPPISVNILLDKSRINEFHNTIKNIDTILSKLSTSLHIPISKSILRDIREPNVHADIQFHIEIPIFSAVPWGHTNVFIGIEKNWSDSYCDYMHSFDAICIDDMDLTTKLTGILGLKNVININILTVNFTCDYKDNDAFNTTYEAVLPVFHMLHESISKRRPSKGVIHCPPILQENDCPPISIITPTYNRRKLIDIAFHNILSTDYPHDKIEWIVVEDNENTTDMASDKIINFQIQVPKIKLKYIPIQGRMTIGEKRNIGIENSTNDIILFMDDDDHYPSTSFRRRVAWLTKGTKRGEVGKANIACCTTLALYDLVKGKSAVNVPPYTIPFSQRISEATLTFRKCAWEERKFPAVSVSEGEEWLRERDNQVIEMPPQQIIVAFSHNENKSSRRIPPSEQPPGCFWGFPKEYLLFIHGLAGVKVEEDKHKK